MHDSCNYSNLYSDIYGQWRLDYEDPTKWPAGVLDWRAVDANVWNAT